MELNQFKEIIELLIAQTDKSHKANDLGISLIDWSNDLYKVIDILLLEIYGKDGRTWIEWFVYEKHFTPSLEAHDLKTGNEICYDIKSLWEHIENLKIGIT